MIQKKVIHKKNGFTALIFVFGLSVSGVFQAQAEETLAQLEGQEPTGQRGTAFGYPIPDTYPLASAGDPAHGE